MSVFAQRPRLRAPATRWVLSRGVRMPRDSVGDAVGKWLKREGLEFRDPTIGPNWLGKTHPFPMNPSFKPPPPISDRTKDAIYERYMADPQKYNVRVLSGYFGVSMKRIDAILRLKGMEKSWIKENKQLQTGFLAGMERMLNPVEISVGYEPVQRKDVNAADMQDQDEVDDHARDRYQRLYWEPVADDEEPIVRQELEKSKEEVKAAKREAVEAKSDIKLLTGDAKKRGTLPREKTVVFTPDRESRAKTVFKDVGGKFLEVEDRVRRMHEAERRKQIKAKVRARRGEVSA